jgi:predicted DNA-binding transcriptional regulator YafY
MRGKAFARQLRLLQLLESRSGGLEIGEAADELNTGRRTVVLQGEGIPLEVERDGKRARWRMMEGYRHRLHIPLTWSEVLALSTGSRLMAGLAGTLFHESAVTALEKIRATLPKGLSERVRAAEATVSTAKGGHDYEPRGALVRQLTEAIEQRITVRARYRSRTSRRGAIAPRLLDPYHLRVSEQGLYVIGFCHWAKELRTFLLDRFDGIEPTEEHFAIQEGFRGEQFLAPTFGMWAGPAKKVSFVVAPGIAGLMMERTLHASQTTQRRSDGSAEVRLEVAIGPPLVAYLVGLGAQVSEIQPEGLRAQVLGQHREAIRAMAAGRIKKSSKAKVVRPRVTQVRGRVRTQKELAARKAKH